MKKLMMATDLSARSDRALERAVSLAREHGASLTVVHVVDDHLPASLADMQKDAATSAIHKHVRELSADNGPPVSIEVIFGRAHAAIVEMSEKTGAEMIVLGMHREDAFKDMFRGTTVERIIRAANVPTLLVKDRVSGPYRQIMVGVDFSVYSRRAVEFAVKFAKGGHFSLVHAYDVPFKGFLHGDDIRSEVSKRHELQFTQMMDQEMASILGGLEVPAARLDRIMQEGTARGVLNQQISRLKPDLLVVGTHGRTGVAHAFLGSIAEEMLSMPPCDVLAVKAW